MKSTVSSHLWAAVRTRTLSQTSAQAEKKAMHASHPRQAIVMPYLSPLMKEGAISSWKMKEGDTFRPGDVLLSIETDYYHVDVEAMHPGILGKILMPAGSSGVKVEEVIALVARDQEELAAMRGAHARSKSVSSSASQTAVNEEQQAPAVLRQTPTERAKNAHRPRSQSVSLHPFTKSPPASPRSAVQSIMPNSAAWSQSSHVNDLREQTMAKGASSDSRDGTAIRRMWRDKLAEATRKNSTSLSLSTSSTGNGAQGYFDGIL